MSGRLKLGQILVNRGLLHPDRLAEALANQQETGARLGTTLVRLGFVDEETLIRTLASQLKLPVARIRGKRVSPEVLECVGVELAEKHRSLPLFFKQEAGERVLFVAMEDPSDVEAQEELASSSGHRVRAVLVGPTELEEALQRHYHWTSLTGEHFEWESQAMPAEAPAPAAPKEAAAAAEPEPFGALGFEAEPAEAPADPNDDSDFDLDPGPLLGEESDELEADGTEEALWADELGEADTSPDLPEPAPAPAARAPDEFDFDDEGGLGAGEEEGFELGGVGGLEAGDAPEPPPAPRVTRRPGPDSLDPRIILRALSQLLVEKGVISRDEFVQRLGEIAAREGGD